LKIALIFKDSSQKLVLTNYGFLLYIYLHTLFLFSCVSFLTISIFFIHETQFSNKLVLKFVCSVISFPECFQPIIVADMCTVAINVVEPGALNIESQYFIPLFNKFS
jgi:hypothetical protein